MKVIVNFPAALVSLITIGSFSSLQSCMGKAETLTEIEMSNVATAPETVNVKIKNYQPQPGNILQNIFVSNFSVKVQSGRLHWSSARDGLSDSLKNSTYGTYGFSLDSPESVVPGYSDLVLFNSGISQSGYGQMGCSSDNLASSSNDLLIYADARYASAPRTLGLRDCQKLYLGLNVLKFDNNGNGIPDYVELRCGMNPLSLASAYTSTAGDGVPNIDKCKMNIPISESATSASNKLFAYRYVHTINPNSSADFSIENIPVMHGGDDNFIAFYVTEVNQNTGVSSLYTAYAVLKPGYVNKTLQFEYWATGPSYFYNQEIIVPSAP